MSTKPTIFFSHSSKDSAIMLSIKNLLLKATGGTLDIFLSSDGQSIPFGSNWVHKIEEGLEQSEIMFVFVTPNSVMTKWIYFEAGFAYSKNIKVIPVGIGINIGALDPPLNLLQGFNIVSGDGLNNFVTIINEKFNYSFPENFSSEDFSAVISSQSEYARSIDLSSIFQYAEYEIYSEYKKEGNDDYICYNLSDFFDSIVAFLSDNKIMYSCQEISWRDQKTLLAYGLKITYNKRRKQNEQHSISQSQLDSMYFSISLCNFEKSFKLFNNILALIDMDRVFLRFILRSNYDIVLRDDHLASIISSYSDEFKFNDKHVGSYVYLNSDISFNTNKMNAQFNALQPCFLGMSFSPKNTTYAQVNNLICSLVDKNVIYKA